MANPSLVLLTLTVLILITFTAATKQPQVQILPPLREQAVLQDQWTADRQALIPSLLKKYKVDAWLVRLPLPSLPPSSFLTLHLSKRDTHTHIHTLTRSTHT